MENLLQDTSVQFSSVNDVAELISLFKKLSNEQLSCANELTEILSTKEALTRTNGNQVHAAILLGINRNTLRKRIAKGILIGLMVKV